MRAEDLNIKRFKEMAAGVFTESQIKRMKDMGFFRKPASLKHHGQANGDLYIHSLMIYELLKDWTEKGLIQWENERSPMVIAFMHDICKADDYIWDYDMNEWQWNGEALLTGHGDKSVIMATSFFPDLTEEEMMCIRYHTGAFEGKHMWNNYTNAVKRYPNILWVHQADMIASQVYGV